MQLSLFDEPQTIESSKGFTFVDLCSGIGGFRIGLENIGGTCIYSAEWDKYAVQAYEHNFNCDVEGDDVNKINPFSIPDHDILACGFPCVSFSRAGQETGFDDPRTDVFWSMMKIISIKQPKIVIIENVKGILRYIDLIKSSYEEQGYRLYVTTLNSKNFKVPQARIRVFLIGIRNDLEGEFIEPTPTGMVTLRSSIDERVPKKYELRDGTWEWMQRHAEKHKAKGNGFGHTIVDLDGIAPTFVKRYHKDGANCLIPMPEGSNPRKATPREVARIMGFPDSFEIVVSNTQAYMQFGNAVCPPVVEAIGKQVRQFLG